MRRHTLPVLSAETQRLLAGWNRFLEALYGQPRQISDLLVKRRVSADEIRCIRRDHLASYLVAVTRLALDWMAQARPDREVYILRRRYSLDSQEGATLAALGQELGITRERVRQLQVRSIRRLGSLEQRLVLECLVRDTAWDTLRRETQPDWDDDEPRDMREE